MSQLPLEGIRIIEFQALGPAPFCGMMLADMGAEVIVVERAGDASPAGVDFGEKDIIRRGKKSICLDLKSDEGRGAALKLVATANGLIEGMRPGVMERLGLGPEECFAVNQALVFGRMTGWGQTGPLAHKAGHDLNYISLSGANWLSGHAGERPFAPPTLVGDLGGGAMYLLSGMLAGLISAGTTGRGQVVDAAIVDGSANMMNLMLGVSQAMNLSMDRGAALLNGPHWYDTYECKDGGYISVGALEPKFYAALLIALDLSDDPAFANQFDPCLWPEQKNRFEDLFITKSREEWEQLFEAHDVCFAPVLSPAEAAAHPHMAARGSYQNVDGTLQGAPAPRFSHAPSRQISRPAPRGQHTAEVLSELGYSKDEINALKAAGHCSSAD